MGTMTRRPTLFDRRGAGSACAQPILSLDRLPEPPGGGPTLDDVITAAWQQLTGGATASCPICHDEIKPVWSAGSRPVGGRCQDCGTRLS